MSTASRAANFSNNIINKYIYCRSHYFSADWFCLFCATKRSQTAGTKLEMWRDLTIIKLINFTLKCMLWTYKRAFCMGEYCEYFCHLIHTCNFQLISFPMEMCRFKKNQIDKIKTEERNGSEPTSAPLRSRFIYCTAAAACRHRAVCLTFMQYAQAHTVLLHLGSVFSNSIWCWMQKSCAFQ